MTRIDFNEKYKDLIHYIETSDGRKLYSDGLCFDDSDVIDFLVEIFETICNKIEGFKFMQIKVKWGKCRFYTNIDGFQFEAMVEEKIDEILRKKLVE